MKRDLRKIFYAADLDESLKSVKAFGAKHGRQFPSACGVLARDLGDCLTFYRFPQEHGKRLRTSNVIERAFREVRRRTNVVGRFPNEMSALTLIWATLEQDRLKWRGLRMDARIRAAMDVDSGARICPEAYEHVDTSNLVQPPGVKLLGIFLALLLGPVVGGSIAEVVRWAVRRRRGRWMWLVVSGCIVTGALVAAFYPFLFFALQAPPSLPLSMLFRVDLIIYTVLAVGTAYARLR